VFLLLPEIQWPFLELFEQFLVLDLLLQKLFEFLTDLGLILRFFDGFRFGCFRLDLGDLLRSLLDGHFDNFFIRLRF
jgi:hypothetical protein